MMFLHLGGDIMVSQDKIIAILDIETAIKNADTEKYLKKINNSGLITHVSDVGKEKSLVITTDTNYLSPISSTTLLKRSQFNSNDDF